MEYAKMKSDGTLEMMPNPYKIIVSNPDDIMKEQIAAMFNWKTVVYTDKPAYDPELQYITERWEETETYIIQRWDVHDMYTEEETEPIEIAE